MTDLRLPANRFFWGVLDTSALPATPPGSKRRVTQLGYLFENVLPVPVESVHVAYLSIGDQRVLACGMETAALSDLRSEGCTTLGPDSLPGLPSFTEIDVDPASINLLHGEFQSPGVRRARRRWGVHAAITVALVIGSALIGVERRVHAAKQHEFNARAARRGVYHEVLAPAGPNAQPDEARFLSEVRTLHKTRTEPEQADHLEDVTSMFAALLERWPSDLRTQTSALNVNAASITLTTTIPDNEQAQQLISALGEFDGWRVAQDSVSPTREGVQLRRAWTREAGGS